MRVRIQFLVLSAICLLTACSTAYQPDGLTGGYSERRLDVSTAQVSFRGNRFNTPDSLHSYLLRRCADVTLQDGYNYFVLEGAERPINLNGAKVDDPYTVTTTIEMFKGIKPATDVHAYDAVAVIRSIPVEEGETAEALPPPPVSVGTSHAASSRTNESTIKVADSTATSSSAVRIPVVNPNALTNQPPPFERF
jgi:hypothetical protein